MEKKGAKKSILDVRRILAIQADHFYSKSLFWYSFTLAEAIALFYFMPSIGHFAMSNINKCIVPDIQDGVLERTKLQWAPADKPNECAILPFDLLLTNTQFYVFFIAALGCNMIVQLNLIYWAIYRAEIPFFEQYKVEKDQPWPWKVDPVGFRSLVIRSFL